MHDCLVALPVGGDAFLLNRSGHQILVDGGSGSARLLYQLANFDIDHLDIVVCTHADMDHAGGLVDFLDNSRVTVGEFWLPGSWAESLPDLITDPGSVVDDLIETLDNWEAEKTWNMDVDRLNEHLHEAVSNQRRKYRESVSSRDTFIPHYSERKENVGLPQEWFGDGYRGELTWREAHQAFNRGRHHIWTMYISGGVPREAAVFWVGLIDTAERIRKIALQAHRHNALVRWFDFGEFAKTGIAFGGEKNVLIPLNSVELVSPPPPPLGLTYLYRLTPVNEECLVFVSPPSSGQSSQPISIVFTGDSPLGDGINYAESWLEWPAGVPNTVIATAPHHGSEHNSAAYRHLLNKADVLLWVRSGGNSLHPGGTYRSISNQRRLCTHCPHIRLPRQTAMVTIGGNGLRTHGHLCSC
ncbi:MBL fold metallo-hydrolase [Pseudomonas rubra]|uniref:MBL fold metallo-hydrolase n=1 Tax=Pseudomonas rubra TaxID=2942627 RepID=A0ABT5PG20_9PSED|nr:MBL fold metallo-hydrolase [Pseudomonas rubra]MDD1017264.1 MBL fold metallo-hydrolase [Pseudomonas rubra]MDD1041691.1 MBL fold metallo-hydrolase [Pseudomonas rubra]MDD1156826.1 MBL fold metallo-hydrolase [Pseudomonas rubra]